MMYYILEGREPKKVDDVIEWANWFENANIHVGDTLINGVRVSTVFLGLSGRKGRVLLFETMIFGGLHDEYQNRCETYDEAERMHEFVINMVKNESHEPECKLNHRILVAYNRPARFTSA